MATGVLSADGRARVLAAFGQPYSHSALVQGFNLTAGIPAIFAAV